LGKWVISLIVRIATSADLSAGFIAGIARIAKIKLALEMAAVLAPKEMARAHGRPVALRLGLVFLLSC
jgi:hypothetical protein